MPEALHIMQRIVNPDIAHSALPQFQRQWDDVLMNLTKLRNARGLSQKALADMIGMDAATINRAEKMHPSAKLTTYVACAEALGVTLEDIFGPDFSAMELKIIEAFRSMPESKREQVAGLLDLIEAQPGTSLE